MKTCSKCNEEKLLDGFHKNKNRSDGRENQCKKCVLARQHGYYHNRGGAQKAKEYCQTEQGRRKKLASNQRYLQSEKGKKAKRRAGKKYAQTEKGIEARQKHERSEAGRASQRRNYQRNKHKWTARSAVHIAIRKGILSHPTQCTCKGCGGRAAQEYHHYLGYEREHHLDVIPLCRECHKE